MSAGWWRWGWLGRRRRSPADLAELAREHATGLHHAVWSVARLNRLTDEEACDLEAALGSRLTENDFEAFRAVRGRGLAIYRLVLVKALEYRDGLWERWRQDAAANGLGEAAAALERLVYEEALSDEEALAAVSAAGDPPPGRATIEAMWGTRPWHGRRPVADLKWQSPNAPRGRELTAIERQIAEALQELPGEDRFALQAHFSSRLPIELLAALQRLEPDELLQRIESHVEALRERLRAAGIDVADMRAVLADPRPGRPRGGEFEAAGPSNQPDMADDS